MDIDTLEIQILPEWCWINLKPKDTVNKIMSTRMDAEFKMDILQHTCGSWHRDESAADTVRSIKEIMRKSQKRYKR
jgi:hypothetical protein